MLMGAFRMAVVSEELQVSGDKTWDVVEVEVY